MSWTFHARTLCLTSCIVVYLLCVLHVGEFLFFGVLKFEKIQVRLNHGKRRDFQGVFFALVYYHKPNWPSMSIAEIIPPFAKLNLPPPEEYHKRRVALISGQGVHLWSM